MDDKYLCAYRNTSYEVDIPGVRIRLHVGEPNSALDSLLKNRDVTEWAFITAYNPRSESCSLEENDQRQKDLLQEVHAQGYPTFPGTGVGENTDWPAEPSVLILGISRETARKVGQKYGQHAIVVGRRGQAPELLWC